MLKKTLIFASIFMFANYFNSNLIGFSFSYPQLSHGEWRGKSDQNLTVSFFVMSDSTIEDFVIQGIQAFWDNSKLYSQKDTWCFEFKNSESDSVRGCFNAAGDTCNGIFIKPGFELKWQASPVQTYPKSQIRLYLKNGFKLNKTYSKLSEVQDETGNTYEWQAPGSGTGRGMLWHGYFLPYDISGNEFKIHLNMAEGNPASDVLVMVNLKIGDDSKILNGFRISDNSYIPYQITFKSDSVFSASKGEEVNLLVWLPLGYGPIGLLWGTGIDSYIEVPGTSSTKALAVKTDNSPTNFALFQNYPNPFNPTTTIKYQLPKDCQVVLKVFNLLGQQVATLVHDHQKAGYYAVQWDASEQASGVYFHLLKTDEFSKLQKMLLLR